jgi:hypothetical protein
MEAVQAVTMNLGNGAAMMPANMIAQKGVRLFSMTEPDGKPSNNAVELQWVTRPNKNLSIKEGRPIFDKCIQLAIISPGAPKQKFSTIVKRVDANGNTRLDLKYFQQFRTQIELFEKNEEGGNLSGTPLSEWPLIDMAQAETLKALRIFTVEQLSSIEGVALQALGMGAQTLKAKAKAWLEQAQGGAPIARLTDENDKLQKTVERQNKTISDMAARLEALEARSETPAAPGKRKRQENLNED